MGLRREEESEGLEDETLIRGQRTTTLGWDLGHFARPDPKWEEMLPTESVPLGVGWDPVMGCSRATQLWVRARISELERTIWMVYHLTFSLWLPSACFQLPHPPSRSWDFFPSLCASQLLALLGAPFIRLVYSSIFVFPARTFTPRWLRTDMPWTAHPAGGR